MHKVAILIGGGLGDCIWGYFNSDFNKKLLTIKKYFDLHVTCYVHSINSQAIELVRYNPNINEIIVEKYMEPVDRKVIGLNYLFDLDTFDDCPMPIYLAEEEVQFCEKIKSYGDFIVLHPFAGEKDRKFDHLVPHIIKYCQSNNICLVIIGGNSFRRGTEEIIENFEGNYENVINLVNQTSVRVCCELVRNCKYFIGSHSCYLSAAWAYDKPALCVVPDHFVSYLLPDEENRTKPFSPNVDKIFRKNCGLMFFSQVQYLQRFMDDFLNGEGFTASKKHGTMRRMILWS